jgi:hypothetical protein
MIYSFYQMLMIFSFHVEEVLMIFRPCKPKHIPTEPEAQLSAFLDAVLSQKNTLPIDLKAAMISPPCSLLENPTAQEDSL